MRRYLSSGLGIVMLCSVLTTPLFTEPLQQLGWVGGIGKGSAITADTTGMDTVYKNPAGVTNFSDATFTSSYGSYFDEFYQSASLGVYLPMARFHVGFHAPVLYVSDVPETVNSGGQALQTGSFANIETAGTVSLGFDLFPNLKVGVSGTYHYKTVNGEIGTGKGFGVGAFGHFGRIDLGVSVQNIGDTQIRWDAHGTDVLPQETHLGTKVQVLNNAYFLSDVTVIDGQDSQVNMGVSFEMSDILAINFGAQNVQSTARYAAGIGLKLGTMQVDYAVSTQELIGQTHKVGVSLAF